MNVVLDFITGVALGIEFPGDGMHCIVYLGPVRLGFVSDEFMEELNKED